jgi:hypothetical protein
VGGNPLSRIDPTGQFAQLLAIPIGQLIVDAATIALGGAMIADNLQSDRELQNEIEKEANRREYKNICNQKPPSGLDPCERAKWELNKARSCKAAREENNRKWWKGKDDKHNPQLYEDMDNQIRNAEKAVERLCKC